MYSIGNQLRLGVRWFDLRPMWLDDKWVIAHASNLDEYVPGVGWQGGSGPYLEEVIDQINDFTRTHAELIVLRITHINDARTGDSVSHRFPDLIQRLWGRLNCIHSGANGQAEHDLQSKPLRYFIGDRKSRIVIVGDDPKKEGASLNTTTDLAQNPSRVMSLDSTPLSVTGELTWFENTPLPFIKGNIIDKANEKQKSDFPTMPQQMWNTTPSSVCRRLEIDNCWNDALLTLCLAASHARIMSANTRQYGNAVVVYGGKLIEDQKVKSELLQAARDRKSYHITDENMGGDVWYGARKACAIFLFADDSKIWAKFGYAGETFEFGGDDGAIARPPHRPDHFYTVHQTELDASQTMGYRFEKSAGFVYPPTSQGVPNTIAFHRLLRDGDHLYTASTEDCQKCGTMGFTYEGVACYLPTTQQAGTTPLYRSTYRGATASISITRIRARRVELTCLKARPG